MQWFNACCRIGLLLGSHSNGPVLGTVLYCDPDPTLSLQASRREPIGARVRHLIGH